MEGALFYSARQCYGYREKRRGKAPGKSESTDAECRAQLKVRKNIDSLTAQELTDFAGP
jgi:hypothetical protein